VTVALTAVAPVIVSFVESMARFSFVITRPNELALVTRWPLIVQL